MKSEPSRIASLVGRIKAYATSYSHLLKPVTATWRPVLPLSRLCEKNRSGRHDVQRSTG